MLTITTLIEEIVNQTIQILEIPPYRIIIKKCNYSANQPMIQIKIRSTKTSIYTTPLTIMQHKRKPTQLLISDCISLYDIYLEDPNSINQLKQIIKNHIKTQYNIATSNQ